MLHPDVDKNQCQDFLKSNNLQAELIFSSSMKADDYIRMIKNSRGVLTYYGLSYLEAKIMGKACGLIPISLYHYYLSKGVSLWAKNGDAQQREKISFNWNLDEDFDSRQKEGKVINSENMERAKIEHNPYNRIAEIIISV